jgi:hypothetical protein
MCTKCSKILIFFLQVLKSFSGMIELIGVSVESVAKSVSFTRVSLWPFRLIFLAIMLLRKLGHPSAIFVHFLHL